MGKSSGKAAGMILAAGYGKRMRPLTSSIPKPMIPILGIPMIELVAAKLLSEGAASLHANSHHLSGNIEEFISAKELPITLHHEVDLLDTGGGIGNMAASLIDEEIVLLANADILTNISFRPAVSFHIRKKALVTMILAAENPSLPETCSPPPHVVIDNDNLIIAFEGARSIGSDSAGCCGYTGMSVISREALEYFPASKKIGLLDILRHIIDERPGSVAGYIVPADPPFSWSEIGTPESFLSLHERILAGKEIFSPLLDPPPIPLHAGRDTRIPPDLDWQGFLEIGPNVAIGRRCSLKNCVVLEDSVIDEGRSIENTIVFPEGEMKTG
ncbi:MAG: NDP-sugar synthase [Candidatus Krumholzibacteriota bacterium]|nr:NDP-sugar synthase [Candidatus Krumholzibacteriota bacterium]